MREMGRMNRQAFDFENINPESNIAVKGVGINLIKFYQGYSD
jgi:hypothetical protein